MSRDKVRTRYLQALAEEIRHGQWWIWDMSHTDREHLDNKYWPTRHSRTLLAIGRDEDDAWAEAARRMVHFL